MVTDAFHFVQLIRNRPASDQKQYKSFLKLLKGALCSAPLVCRLRTGHLTPLLQLPSLSVVKLLILAFLCKEMLPEGVCYLFYCVNMAFCMNPKVLCCVLP